MLHKDCSVSVIIFRWIHPEYYAEGIHTNFIYTQFDKNSANDEASAKLSPFHVRIGLGKRLSMLASCMTNPSERIIVFSSSALIRINKDAFKGHLC